MLAFSRMEHDSGHASLARCLRSLSQAKTEPPYWRWCPDKQEELNRIAMNEHGCGDLQSMHERSLAGQVDGNLLKMSSSAYARHRKEAVQYLVARFEEAQLRDIPYGSYHCNPSGSWPNIVESIQKHARNETIASIQLYG